MCHEIKTKMKQEQRLQQLKKTFLLGYNLKFFIQWGDWYIAINKYSYKLIYS